jgi:excinuclease ABC subunit B
MSLQLESNQECLRDQFLRELIKIQYARSDVDFHRGTFRVRGDSVDIFPTYEDQNVLRVEFFGDFIENLFWVDPIRGTILSEADKATVYPGSHYVTSQDRLKVAVEQIREELRHRINHYESLNEKELRDRIEKRTLYDIEMIEEMGFCQGIENYSRHLSGRDSGAPPPTLLEYFEKNFLTVIDESHITIPQIGGMYKGDRARKTSLVDFAFRLPSALDNRPLNFEEFGQMTGSTLYVSATPKEYELEASGGLVIEQVIRPTGLVDPIVEIKPATHQVDQLLVEVKKEIEKENRVLVTTLTKRSAEDLTAYFSGLGIKVKYLHSDIKTMERSDIIRDLRLGVFDVLVGINLLREGLDIPEVSLIGILDADKEGFLRSERSLIQTIGRAARNVEGRVILFADHETDSIKKAIKETNRRRTIQEAYNKKHGITPQSVSKTLKSGLTEVYVGQYKEESAEEGLISIREKVLEYKAKKGGLPKQILRLRNKMKKASEKLEFETAAEIRDEIKRLELIDLETI